MLAPPIVIEPAVAFLPYRRSIETASPSEPSLDYPEVTFIG
jgi:hypothetical protein